MGADNSRQSDAPEVWRHHPPGLARPLRGGNRVGGRAGAGIFITRSDEYSPGVRLCALGLSTQFGTLDAECPDNGNRGFYSLTNRVPRPPGPEQVAADSRHCQEAPQPYAGGYGDYRDAVRSPEKAQ